MLGSGWVLAASAFAASLPLLAANLDMSRAVIAIPGNASTPEKKAAAMLAEEIEKRTQLRLKVQSQAPSGPAFVLGRADQLKSPTAPRQAEAFTVAVTGE